ncbi:C-terminal regulatory domain of Threonine dehydratase family protein, partial [Vibrio parahaemolyticus V-223/04]
RLRLLA